MHTQLMVKASEGGDAQTLIDILDPIEDNDFFFRIKLDELVWLSNVLQIDSMMKEDYKIFGDVGLYLI